MAQNVGESRGGEGHVMTHQATPGSHAMERTAAGAVTEDEEEGWFDVYLLALFSAVTTVSGKYGSR